MGRSKANVLGGAAPAAAGRSRENVLGGGGGRTRTKSKSQPPPMVTDAGKDGRTPATTGGGGGDSDVIGDAASPARNALALQMHLGLPPSWYIDDGGYQHGVTAHGLARLLTAGQGNLVGLGRGARGGACDLRRGAIGRRGCGRELRRAVLRVI